MRTAIPTTLVLTALAATVSVGFAHDPAHDPFGPSSGVRAHTAPAVSPVELLPAGTILGYGDHMYTPVPGWCQLPEGKPLGNTHGGIMGSLSVSP